MSFCAGLGDWGPLCVCPRGLRFEETTVEVPAAYWYKSYSTSSSRVVLEYLLQLYSSLHSISPGAQTPTHSSLLAPPWSQDSMAARCCDRAAMRPFLFDGGSVSGKWVLLQKRTHLDTWHTQPKNVSHTFSSWSCLRSTDHIFMLWFSLTLTRDTLRYYGDIMEIEMGEGSFTHASSLPIWYTQPQNLQTQFHHSQIHGSYFHFMSFSYPWAER